MLVFFMFKEKSVRNDITNYYKLLDVLEYLNDGVFNLQLATDRVLTHKERIKVIADLLEQAKEEYHD